MPSSPRSHRRDFLTGKLAAKAAAQLAESLPNPTLPARESGYQVHYTRRAMACDFEIVVPFCKSERVAQGAMSALDCVEQLEAELSIYRPDSAVSQWNLSPAGQFDALPEAAWEILDLSVRLSRATNGAFDPTAGRLDQLWRQTRKTAALPSPADVASALAASGVDRLALRGEDRSAQKKANGLELNFGGIGKGFALDRAAQRLREHGIQHALLQAGNSSVLAMAPEGKSDLPPWEVSLINPREPSERLRTITISAEGLSTSSSQVQAFSFDGKTYGHLIDPRTGWPAQGVLSVTVCAPSAAEAEALSTAFYILGPTEAEKVLRNFPDAQAYFVMPASNDGIELLEIGPFRPAKC